MFTKRFSSPLCVAVNSHNSIPGIYSRVFFHDCIDIPILQLVEIILAGMFIKKLRPVIDIERIIKDSNNFQ